MYSLLNALYDLLSFITEDARAHELGYDQLSPGLRESMKRVMLELEKCLD